MDTWQYVGEQVKVTDIDGNVVEGYASSAETRQNSGRDGFASLDIDVNGPKVFGTVLVYEDEIKIIEIIK